MRKLLFLFNSFLPIGVLGLILSGCASYDHRLNDKSTPYLGTDGSLLRQARADYADQNSYWDGDDSKGAPSIVIDISEQRLYYYKDNRLVGVSAISTGSQGRETQPGHFKICQKDLKHVSSECGDYVDAHGNIVVKNILASDPKPPGTKFQGAPMPYFMRIHDGVGMHTGFLPGVPDSHGCIRLPDRMAKIFFEVTPMGTPVVIQK